ncbi:MAG TPA: signal peptidase II [Candidatus Methylomirabilis sp.]|nr:signal peptidase II [Candidatus Methylomirabilis sp.]
MNPTAFYTIAVSITLLDQVSKFYVQKTLRLGQVVPVIPSFFNLTHVLNPGAAFGFLSGAPAAIRHPLFTAISIFAVLFIIYYRTRHRQMRLLPSVALACILGGAVGNLIDRLRLGMVVDFLDFHYGGNHWPAFNVADSAITIGVALMILEIVTDRERG